MGLGPSGGRACLTQEVRLDQLTLAAAIILVFAFIGYRRGILRELVAAPAILLAPIVGPWLGVVLTPWVKRFYKLFLFARYGGLATDDFGPVMEKVRQAPPIIKSDADIVRLGLICFLVIIGLGYALGEWRIKRPDPKDAAARLLGAVMGGINGYMLFRAVLPKVWSAEFAQIIVPTGSVLQLFNAQTAVALVLAFIALVAFGLNLAQKKK